MLAEKQYKRIDIKCIDLPRKSWIDSDLADISIGFIFVGIMMYLMLIV